MTNPSHLTRRDFLATTVTFGAGAVFNGIASARTAVVPQIKVACCSLNFAPKFAPGVDPVPAIETIGELGFDGIELLVMSSQDLKPIWSGEKLTQIQAALAKQKLAVTKVGAFSPMFGSIFSPDAKQQQAALDGFADVCAVAKQLGAAQVGYVGWSVPGTSPNVYTFKKDPAKPEVTKLQMPIPADLDWEKLWVLAVSHTRAVLERAKAHGLTVCVEPHYHGIPQSAEQFLLLQKEVSDPALGFLLDTCWSAMQCAYPPLLVRMMGRHTTNVQFRDTDAQTRNAFVNFGEGIVDFSATLAALRAEKYAGFISLEDVFKKPDTARKNAQNYLAFMKAELAKA